MQYAVVASIEEFAERYHVPKAFIGLILLPIVVRADFQMFAKALANEFRFYFYCTWSRTLNVHSGKRGGARHISVDGNEGPNGTHHHNLCRQLDRASLFSVYCIVGRSNHLYPCLT